MQNKIDLYLNRASHASQLLLVCFAIFGYFYTVRPIYQNASLQESIAKKETELKSLQIKIDDLYSNLRRELVRKFVVGVTYDCSPVTSLIMQPPRQDVERRKSFDIEVQELKSLAEKGLYDCLKKSIESKTVIAELRDSDKQKLINIIESLRPEILGMHEKLMREITDDKFLLKLGEEKSIYTKELDQFLAASGIKIPDDKKMLEQIYILSAMRSLIADYGIDFNSMVLERIEIND
ncbi:TPA: hypothetical protein U5D43_001285 [Yersinia enterocolitica]|nr:hypothetical protein [Yersinia enterocolitica]